MKNKYKSVGNFAFISPLINITAIFVLVSVTDLRMISSTLTIFLSICKLIFILDAVFVLVDTRTVCALNWNSLSYIDCFSQSASVTSQCCQLQQERDIAHLSLKIAHHCSLWWFIFPCSSVLCFVVCERASVVCDVIWWRPLVCCPVPEFCSFLRRVVHSTFPTLPFWEKIMR